MNSYISICVIFKEVIWYSDVKGDFEILYIEIVPTISMDC